MVLLVVFINMVAILMISTKLHAVGLPKIKVFWNKGYDIIIYVNDVTDKVLPLDANYTADVVEPQFYNDLTRKNNFLSSTYSSSSIIWDWH